MRQQLVEVIACAKQSGIRRRQSGELLQIQLRRIQRWELRQKASGSMDYGKPGPRQVLHGIMPAERERLLDFAAQAQTVDYSFQVLAIKGAEQGLFFMSASSVRVILHEQGLGDDRREHRRRGSNGKPARPEDITAPNQCWCWDISYLKTDIRCVCCCCERDVLRFMPLTSCPNRSATL